MLLYSKCSCCDLQTDALQNVAAISEFWRNGILLKNVWFSLQWCTVRVDVWLQIKILVSSITNITKKKTAIIIPNAVGIVTEDHKVLYCMSSAHCLVWFLLFCMSSVLLFPLSSNNVHNSTVSITVHSSAHLVWELLKFLRQKPKNGFTTGDERWRVHSVTPADENWLCPMSVRAF